VSSNIFNNLEGDDMGYKLVARIRDDKVAVGYIIQDTRSKTYEIL